MTSDKMTLPLLATALLLMWSSSVATASFLAPSEVNTCDISEFRCPSKDGQGTLCLPMDRWCNGKDDCDNRVDEPRSCTSEYPAPIRIVVDVASRRRCAHQQTISVRVKGDLLYWHTHSGTKVFGFYPANGRLHRLLSGLRPFVTARRAPTCSSHRSVNPPKVGKRRKNREKQPDMNLSPF